MENTANICGVVVTHDSGSRVTETLAAALPQLAQLFIVDNASGPETVQAITAFAAEHAGKAHVLHNATNLGLATAQNQGIAKALENGAEWVLLLDHDSVPEHKMVVTLLAQGQRAGDPRIGIMAPLLVEQNLSYTARYLVPLGRYVFTRRTLGRDEILRDAAAVIASGCLIKAELLREIGFMREDFFIDNIDYEFCLRARKAGWHILVAGQALLYHRQGYKTRHHFLGISIITANYNPMRRYTMTRNRLFLLRLHARVFPFVIMHELTAITYDIARILFIERQKSAKLAAMARGLWHGLTQKL